MIEKVGLVIPEAEAVLINAGELVRTNGVLRNAENMEIFKHLQIVDLDAESCWQELGNAVSRVLKENKKGVIVVVSVVVAAATATGIYVHNKKKKAKELEEKCNAWINKAIQNYVESASKGELDIESISACEDALMSLPHITDKVFVSMTKEQILEFTKSLKEYTMKLAEVNEYELIDADELEYSDNVITCFIKNLQAQKEIISATA